MTASSPGGKSAPITLSSLAPRRGELLWDVGGGAGSIGIEWMLRHPANRAIAIERDPAPRRADRPQCRRSWAFRA